MPNELCTAPSALLLFSNAQARYSRLGNAMRILVIEDDPDLSDLVARDLRAVGYTVDAVDLAESGLHAAIDVAYSAIIVDLRLPDRDGLDLVREMRGKSVRTPILILTGRRRVADRVAGLEAGADDYLIKPFALAELRARLSALGRRPVALTSSAPSFADIAFDARGMEATVTGKPLSLSRQELRLLRLLVDRGGHVISKRHDRGKSLRFRRRSGVERHRSAHPQTAPRAAPGGIAGRNRNATRGRLSPGRQSGVNGARRNSRRAAHDADPVLEFRLRAARDRDRIARLAGMLRAESDWHLVAGTHSALEDLAHGLSGTGGTFGFPALSVAAARVERLTEGRRLRPPSRYTRKQIALLADMLESLIAELDAITP